MFTIDDHADNAAIFCKTAHKTARRQFYGKRRAHELAGKDWFDC